MPKLIREFIDIKDIDILKEDFEIDGIKKKNYFLTGPFLEAETKNRNGRRYRLNVLAREVQAYNENYIAPKRSLGQLDHSDTPMINLDRVSHLITELYMKDNIGYGKAKLLDTPMGKIAKTLVDEGILLGMSTCGLGTLDGEWVSEDFSLIGVDIIHSPSAPSAFVKGVLESKEYIMGENDQIIEVAVKNLKEKVDERSNKFERKDVSSLMLRYMLEFIDEIKNKN